jgi:D-tyrosyl-tRNA(Tyr) deacylase
MRAVIQRVSRAQVEAEGVVTGSIGLGLLVMLGVGEGDTEADAVYLADKIVGLRIFEDDAGKMNLSVSDSGGAVLVVSQFTLYGDVRKGRRPSFASAAAPAVANELYKRFCTLLQERGLRVETGVFQATMEVSLLNHGPVTILLDSAKLF